MSDQVSEFFDLLSTDDYIGEHDGYKQQYGENTIFRVIDGAKCRDVKSALREIGDSLEFPDYFRENWDSLDECINDMEWLQGNGYVLVFKDAAKVLDNSDREFTTLLHILAHAKAAWGEPVPEDADWRWTKETRSFKIVFVVDANLAEGFRQRCQVALESLKLL